MNKQSDDALGDRMKEYEAAETEHYFMPRLPILARLDGRSFHTFTRGMERPYDSGFMRAMHGTTNGLVKETHARIGYTQSDEITLLFYSNEPKSETFFSRKKHKLVSVLASLATGYFNRLIASLYPGKSLPVAAFDCRVWQVPSEEEATNVFVWREQDAMRNSLQMLCQAHFSKNDLFGKDRAAQHDLLKSKEVSWSRQIDEFKRGAYFRRVNYEATVGPEVPEKHRPKGPVIRSRVDQVKLPPLTQIKNRKGVIFWGHEPEPMPPQEPT